MESDEGRMRVARATARLDGAASALDEAVAAQGEQFREAIPQPAAQGE